MSFLGGDPSVILPCEVAMVLSAAFVALMSAAAAGVLSLEGALLVSTAIVGKAMLDISVPHVSYR